VRLESFFKLVAAESERTVTREVSSNPPELLTKVAKSGGMLLTDFLSAPDRRVEAREFRYRHVLGPPASPEAIDAWQAQRCSYFLPGDLRDLVLRANGIHLWANAEDGRSYVGLAPIEEWDLARVKMYGPAADRTLVDDRYLAISYHQDGAAFVVLDQVSGEYYLMDSAGPDTTAPIGNNVGSLLDWLWRTRTIPKVYPA
jgi:hypothetical protein